MSQRVPLNPRGRHFGCRKLILAFLFRESGSSLQPHVASEQSPSGWWARTQKHMMLQAWGLLRNRNYQVRAVTWLGLSETLVWGGEGWQDSAVSRRGCLPKGVSCSHVGQLWKSPPVCSHLFHELSWAVQAEFQEYSLLEMDFSPAQSHCVPVWSHWV